MTWLTTLLRLWAASLLFAAWSGLCVIVGILLGVSAALTALEANGIHAARELARMVAL